MSRRCLEESLDSQSPAPWCRQQLPVSAASGLFVLFCLKWGCGSVACAQLCVCTRALYALSFRPSVRASGTPPWSWDLPGRHPAWCWSLCGCSSSGRHAWPYTCGCKHNTTRHTHRDRQSETQQSPQFQHNFKTCNFQNTSFKPLIDRPLVVMFPTCTRRLEKMLISFILKSLILFKELWPIISQLLLEFGSIWCLLLCSSKQI